MHNGRSVPALRANPYLEIPERFPLTGSSTLPTRAPDTTSQILIEGRLEVDQFTSGPRAGEGEDQIVFYGRDGSHEVITVPKLEGSHGGSDDLLLKDLVEGRTDSDPLGQQATSTDGVYSLIIGAAANEAITSRDRVGIEEFLSV